MRFRSICPKSLKTYSQFHQFEGFFVQIENSSFHLGDLNNNNNIGFPVFGGYKEILGLDVTILDSSSTRPILSHLVQYFLVSSSRISNIT